MKIVALPDLHGSIAQLSLIRDVLAASDLVLLVGDLTNNGSAADAAQIVDGIKQSNSSVLAIPGNWDGPDVHAYLTETGINIHRRHITRDGIAFTGLGASLASPSHAPNEISEEEFAALFAELASGLERTALQILVCHQPPVDTLNDKTWTGLHVGSKAVREFIEKTQPAICFTGHIHEALGVDAIGFTRTINPGPLWQGRYAYAEVTHLGVLTLEIRESSPRI
jgi:Icc-related predicted phosphoesterase